MSHRVLLFFISCRHGGTQCKIQIKGSFIHSFIFAGGSRQADRAAAAAAPIRFTFITAVPDRIPDRFSPVPAVPSTADEPSAAIPRTTTTAPQPPTASPLPPPTPPPPTSSAAVLPAAVPRSRLNTDSSLPSPPSVQSTGGSGVATSIASEPLVSRRPILARENEIENRFAPLPSATVPTPTASPSATEVEGGDEGPTRNRKARREKVY
jgi:hypothetical protein